MLNCKLFRLFESRKVFFLVKFKPLTMSLHSQKMECPTCRSTEINKNGRRGTKQSYRCKDCGRQFVESYGSRGYSKDAKQICLNLYNSGMGFRAIERATGVSHNTVINWVREEGAIAPDVSEQPDSVEQTETTKPEAVDEFGEDAVSTSQAANHWCNKGNGLLTRTLSVCV